MGIIYAFSLDPWDFLSLCPTWTPPPHAQTYGQVWWRTPWPANTSGRNQDIRDLTSHPKAAVGRTLGAGAGEGTFTVLLSIERWGIGRNSPKDHDSTFGIVKLR